jgi:hypothetical protein
MPNPPISDELELCEKVGLLPAASRVFITALTLVGRRHNEMSGLIIDQDNGLSLNRWAASS